MKTKIALSIPDSRKHGRYFSFGLKKNLFNESTTYSKPHKILVVSNIEGSFNSLVRLLYKSKVINKRFEWTFNNNHLVILGDCLNDNNQAAECLWLIYSLEERARGEGGHIHFILGNHEIMNINGDWRYIQPNYAMRKKGLQAVLYDGNNELWRWLRTKNIVEKIGDILFVHAGIASELIKCNLSVTEINDLARPYYTYPDQQLTGHIQSLVYNRKTSPFWYEGYYQGIVSDQQIDETLAYFDVNTIITGHTLVSQVSSFFNGKVINVNTGNGLGDPEGLLINKGGFYRVTTQGVKERIK